MPDFPPSRNAAHARLTAFLPAAGVAYARTRNFDRAGHVSALSPYIRHRVITEEDVLRATRAAHSYKAAEKFIQEVYWRTYWKGWLELRPAVWDQYKADRTAAWNAVQTQSGLRQRWQDACAGDTGIACFDHWARELVQTGYLHNHARMWFASIWIFTLQLPWSLGADFFLRHLLDGDPAANTLSWRWVGGLQTVGKTYLARRANIAEHTDGRFDPAGLASHAPPLTGPPAPRPGPPPVSDPLPTSGRIGLLVTEEDMSPDWLHITPVATAFCQTTDHRSHLQVAPQVTEFVSKLSDAPKIIPAGIRDWMTAHKLDHVVTSYIPVGPTRDALAEAPLIQRIRAYDAAAWPRATAGFFKFKTAIPSLLAGL
ncbi:FAD-binding domain-containing protein [Yoonia sp. R2331]|uniref:FAD-binding domain-containing protein n=1 Tax=Yoonia sp. R2331 TaxID=3237238 RepID=UPI0034E3E7C9